jgi:hypothetical protein
MTLRGPIVIHKLHPLARNSKNFGITPCLQELICFIGMQHTYAASYKIFKKLLDIDVTAKQIERVCTFYGKKLYEIQSAIGIPYIKSSKKADVLYVLIDGSFVPIRNTSLQKNDLDFVKGKDSWKEVKLARLIEGRHIVKGISKDRNYVSHSDYLAHLGNREPFLEQLRQSIDNRKFDKMVFVGDGAKWIWNWVEDTFTQSTQILDFFHAMEHISDHSKIFFQEEQTRKDWVELQQTRLLSDQVKEVLDELETELVIGQSKVAQESLSNLKTYINENQNRMLYKTYKKQGLEIGSGAIESAHRTIIQQRAKLSGQRWTMEGVQSILSLRATYHSGRWEELLTLIKGN